MMILLSSFLLSCVEELDPVNGDTNDSRIFVEGYITTQPGPHTITISRTAPYGSVFNAGIDRVKNAKVSLRDDLGNYFIMMENNGGKYRTSENFSASIGRSYALLIETLEGEDIQSLPQFVIESPDIDDVFLRYRKDLTEDPDQFNTGVEVYVKFNDFPDERNFYLWRATNGVHPWIASPELFAVYTANSPAPPPCPPGSFDKLCWRYETNYEDFVEPITCLQINRTHNSFFLGSDFNLEGTETIQQAAYIEDDGLRFQFRYRFILNHMAISAEAHGYYSSLESLQEIEGDIFDPPPIEIRGNLVDIKNPENKVIGFFGAYDTKTEEIYIPATLMEEKQNDKLFINECRYLDRSVDRRPSWWAD